MLRKSLLVAAGALAAMTVNPLPATQARAATQSRSCAVDNVAVIDARMHIKCAPIRGQAYTAEFATMPCR
jgi:hypothetical protein